jgi:hypothetical protein
MEQEPDTGFPTCRHRGPARSGVAAGPLLAIPASDASEGTALDPLLNKTYDLSYAKVVPADTALK